MSTAIENTTKMLTQAVIKERPYDHDFDSAWNHGPFLIHKNKQTDIDRR